MIKTGKGISMKVYNGLVNVKKHIKGQQQHLIFNCSANHMKCSLKKLGGTYKLQSSLLKQEIYHTEIYEDTWEAEREIWEPYFRMDILSVAFVYAQYSMNMENTKGFGMKDCLSLPSLGWKYFNSQRCEDDEDKYCYTDKYMRHFVIQSIKAGKVGAFNQSYGSVISNDISNIISFELGITGNNYEIIENYNSYIKTYKSEFENEYN